MPVTSKARNVRFSQGKGGNWKAETRKQTKPERRVVQSHRTEHPGVSRVISQIHVHQEPENVTGRSLQCYHVEERLMD